VDASGSAAGEHGGQVSVRGQKVLLDLAAVLDASGNAGGGKVTVGGDWQGGPSEAGVGANAEMTHVAAGARIDVSATGTGDGGVAVVWSENVIVFFFILRVFFPPLSFSSPLSPRPPLLLPVHLFPPLPLGPPLPCAGPADQPPQAAYLLPSRPSARAAHVRASRLTGGSTHPVVFNLQPAAPLCPSPEP